MAEMKKSTILILLVLAVAAFIAYKLLWTAAEPEIEHRVAEVGLTANEIAANGPLPGDVSLYQKELAAQQQISTSGYCSSLNGAEIADAQRSGLFPAATFTGSFDGPNRVFAWRSEDRYEATAYINNRKPGELYIGGRRQSADDGSRPSRPVCRQGRRDHCPADLAHLCRECERVCRWFGATNLNILPNGNIVLAWENNVALLDGDSGLIVDFN
jgi:hypothetical protein